MLLLVLSFRHFHMATRKLKKDGKVIGYERVFEFQKGEGKDSEYISVFCHFLLMIITTIVFLAIVFA